MKMPGRQHLIYNLLVIHTSFTIFPKESCKAFMFWSRNELTKGPKLQILFLKPSSFFFLYDHAFEEWESWRRAVGKPNKTSDSNQCILKLKKKV